MSVDLNVTATVQLTANENAQGVTTGPSCGPFPFGLTEVGLQQPWTQTAVVLPTDAFGASPLTVPSRMRGAVGSGKQVFLLIKTDLPVVVRVRDVATVPVEFERTLGVGGSVMIAGGDPDVDQIDFAGVATSNPQANVSVWLVARQ